MSEQQASKQPKTALFREKSLEAVESPESLNDYLRVTSPGVWLVLAAVIALLVGTILWGIFGSIDTKRKATIITSESKTICLVPFQSFDDKSFDEIEIIMNRGTVEIGGTDYKFAIPDSGEVEIGFVNEFVTSENLLPMTYAKGGLSSDDLVVCLPMETSFADGVQTGSVVTESIHPISLLLQ